MAKGGFVRAPNKAALHVLPSVHAIHQQHAMDYVAFR